MRLQGKLTIALLITGLLSAGAVAGTAYWMLMRDFRQSVMDQAYENFSRDIRAYLKHSGTTDWNLAEQRLPFSRFVTEIAHPKRLHSEDFIPPPPPEGVHPRGATPGFPPSPRFASPVSAPFKFVVLDPAGTVLKSIDGYEHGSRIEPSLLSQSQPITIDGQTVVRILPLGDPQLSPKDQAYLDAVRHALISGGGAALLLALLIGLLFGGSLSRKINSLIRAVRKMQADRSFTFELEVRSRDEFGDLEQAFNQMNRELGQAHQELLDLSIKDPLTGLYNRRHFDQQANHQYQQASRYSQPLTIMVGDLDHFKQINDRFSHLTGDQVLNQVAKLLRQGIRKCDVVARYGGEEFVLMLPNTSLDQALRCCEALRSQIEAYPWQQLAPGLNVTMSMGLSDQLGDDGVEKLIDRADKQLYRAKHAGRNRVYHDGITAAAPPCSSVANQAACQSTGTDSR
ncbi:GGDEF domain-containing protein [Motiliproteus sp.]|uniref:GGDEF domain-containing protein n=1 Tax=Motiliproteus sp. TaxID=1898955 RepID=UPI003BAB1553